MCTIHLFFAHFEISKFPRALSRLRVCVLLSHSPPPRLGNTLHKQDKPDFLSDFKYYWRQNYPLFFGLEYIGLYSKTRP